MVDLVSLQLFVRAIDLGSLSRTAEVSNIALAAVSRRMALLEEYYGVALLQRTGRGVTPTAAGAVLLERARHILQQTSLARSDLADYARGKRGCVDIEASTSAITQFLPADLAAFGRAFPEIRLNIREAYSSEIIAALRNGDCEVGVVMAGHNVEGLETWPYRHDRLALVVRADFRPDMAGTRLAEVADEDFIQMEDMSSTTRLLMSVAAAEGYALRLRVQVDSFDAVCRMIQAGFGVGVLPEGAAVNFVDRLGLRLVRLDEAWADREMRICANPLLPAGAAAARLIDFLARAA